MVAVKLKGGVEYSTPLTSIRPSILLKETDQMIHRKNSSKPKVLDTEYVQMFAHKVCHFSQLVPESLIGSSDSSWILVAASTVFSFET